MSSFLSSAFLTNNFDNTLLLYSARCTVFTAVVIALGSLDTLTCLGTEVLSDSQKELTSIDPSFSVNLIEFSMKFIKT